MHLEIEHHPAHAKWIGGLLKRQEFNRRALVEEVRDLLIEGNARDRLDGVGKDGRPLIHWKHRLGAYAGKTGPTLAPNGRGSRSVRAFFASGSYDPKGSTVRAGFRGDGVEVLGYHALGISGAGRPVFGEGGKIVRFVGIKGKVTGIKRDVMGVSPRTRREIREACRATARSTWLGRALGSVSRRAASFLGSIFG